MSDAIYGFMTKYHAVPADDRGPDWKNANTAALVGHLEGMMEACNTDASEKMIRRVFAAVRLDMARVARELLTRNDLPPEAAGVYTAELLFRIIETCDPVVYGFQFAGPGGS